MTTSPLVKTPKPDSKEQARYLALVARFVSTWLAFMAVLIGLAFLVDLDWARPRVQRMLAEAFQRPVKLGKLSWQLGFNGLAIATDSLAVSDSTGEPFVRAGGSEIGVAFMPLLRGQLLIRYLAFDKPEVWAVKLPDGHWNFDDLLKPGPDIRFIQVERGRLHMANHCAGSKEWKRYDFDEVKLKFIWPKNNKRWPLYLSFAMPRDSYTTRVDLTLIGNGLLERWRDNRYKFELAVDRLNPLDLGPLAAKLPGLGGLFKLKLSGEGTLAAGVRARAEAAVEKLKFATPRTGEVFVPHAEGTADITLDKNTLSWTNLVLRLADLELRSKGVLSGWHKKVPTYSADLAASITDLGRLKSFSTQPVNLMSGKTAPVGGIWADKLSGSARVDFKVTGKEGLSQLMGDIKVNGVPAEAFFIGARGDALGGWVGIGPKARISGTVRLGAGGELEFPDIEIVADGSTIKAKGTMDRQTGAAAFTFNGAALPLCRFEKHLSSSPELRTMLAKFLALPGQGRLSLRGLASISGRIDSFRGEHKPTLKLELSDAGVTIADSKLSPSHVNGEIRVDGDRIVLKQVSGIIDGGTFELGGQITTGSKPQVDATFHASHIDLDRIGEALRILKVRIPVLAERQLWGRVRDFSLTIGGSPQNPTISLSALPDDLYYQPPGLTRPLKAVSGQLSYDHDELILREVGLVSQDNKLTASLAIDNLSGQARLKRLKVKSTGVELSEVDFYLGSPLMPPSLRSAYVDFISAQKLTALHGKAYGDLLWRPKGADFDLEGVIGFHSVGGRAGQWGLPLEGLSGLVAASGSELLLQDVNGRVGASTFTANAHVVNYRSDKITWQGEAKTRLMPAELMELIPGLAGTLNLEVTCRQPIAARASFSGTPANTGLVFSARAEADAHLKLTGPCGAIHQPEAEAMALDGSMTLRPGGVVVHSSNLLVGRSILHGSGSYAWPDSARKDEPTLTLHLDSPNPIAAHTLIAVVDPQSAAGVSGAVNGTIDISGPVSALVAGLHIDFDDLSLPQYNLKKIKGQIEAANFLLTAQAGRPASDSDGSRARLALRQAEVGELSFDDVEAELILLPGAAGAESPKVVLRSGSAGVAGGQLAVSGWLDLSEHRFRTELALTKVKADQVVADITGRSGEISGQADARLTLSSQGTDYRQLLRNLAGSGSITVTAGKVARFGKLQERLTQANFIQQGLFGFNLNNLLQSVVPVRTGEFKELRGRFEIAAGVLSVEELRFNGDDMRLRAAGRVNLPMNTIDLKVAGNIPRVSSSVIGGAVGEVSRELTLQKFLHALTFRKLENLPSVPLLGDIASDRPRAFAFQVAASLEKPDTIAHSIEKTFHWLPNQPNATAHPVPGITAF